jgi:Flp pilus assembly protein TadD
VEPTVLSNLAASLDAANPAEAALRFSQSLQEVAASVAADTAIRASGDWSRVDVASVAARIDLPSVQRHPRLSEQ